MSKKKHKNQLGMVALLSVIFGVSVLVAGCDGEPQDEGEPAKKVEPDERVDAGIVSDKEVGKVNVEEPTQETETVAENIPLIVEQHPPILHLAMDDNAASPTVLDSSEGQNNQTFGDPSGNPNVDAHSVSGVVGAALAFDGVDDSIIVLAEQAGPIFAAGTDFSVACWWRSDSDPFPDGYREILTNYKSGGGGIILFQRGDATGTYKRIYMNFYVAGNGAPVLFPYIDVPENTGRWHHYVFQREGSTLRAWRDGRLRGSYTDPVVSGDMGSEVDFRINSPSAGAEGALDEMRIYPRALFSLFFRRRLSNAKSNHCCPALGSK